MQIKDNGKFVTIKQDRNCYICKKSLPKNTKCFTQSITKNSKRFRIWQCSEHPLVNQKPYYPKDWLPKDF